VWKPAHVVIGQADVRQHVGSAFVALGARQVLRVQPLQAALGAG
jgi:hypothetical protein